MNSVNFFYIYFNHTFYKCLCYIIDNSELVEANVLKNKCSRIDNICNKSETGIEMYIYIICV